MHDLKPGNAAVPGLAVVIGILAVLAAEFPVGAAVTPVSAVPPVGQRRGAAGPEQPERDICRAAALMRGYQPAELDEGRQREFLRALRERGTRTGLVTSSEEEKVRRILTVMPLEGMFDTIVHACRVKRGKPAPDCYLLAASDLGVRPADCLVFEDSLNGIQAGNAAGMRVIGVASTNPPEALRDKVFDVIPDFKGKTFDDFLRWQA